MADLPDAPLSREEDYLASIAGQNVEVPPCPRSRKEAYLDAIDTKMDGIEEDIEALKNNPDVVDIVDTYTDLQAYDKTKLTDNDIIRVLNDETHEGESTYYRYSTSTQTWTYVGSAGGSGGGPTVVQVPGVSTTDVMSQNATTGLVYRINAGGSYSDHAIKIGGGATTSNNGVSIGYNAGVTSTYGVAVGSGTSSAAGSVALGQGARALGANSVALGRGAQTSLSGVVEIGSTNSMGYDNSNYRLLSGVYNGQADHDAVNVSQVNAVIDAINTALSTNIPHIGA